MFPSTRKLGLLVLFCSCVMMVSADIYLHQPRGSNNRLTQGNNNNVGNANRLFDSQNNNKGGYAVGSIYHYAGSIQQIEWTNQHSCGGDGRASCELVLQYMCQGETPAEGEDPGIRDGTTNNRIPDDAETSKLLEFGRHESYEWYQKCKNRERNGGLFAADQLNTNNNNQKATRTRQNPNQNRYGFECAEERDYYPYWHPSEWKDIAVLTNNQNRCAHYQGQSQNVVSKGECTQYLHNNQADCEAQGATWEVHGKWGIGAPECREAPTSRDNHLGNALGTNYAAVYNWLIPSDISEKCVFRMRYNITTADYPAWDDNGVSQIPANKGKTDKVDLSEVNAAYAQAAAGEYLLTGNPTVNYGIAGVDLTLAVNTAQFGRTFEDRSHAFGIRPAPVDGTIHNINVRGRRGNIVQCYPAVEYDFAPNTMMIERGDYVHLTWTGSNENANNQAGEGQDKSDRSNIVQIADLGVNYPMKVDQVNPLFLPGGANKVRLFAFLDDIAQANTNKLNNAGVYFDGGLVKHDELATYNYMSTRNNNFSNRSQKARIIVIERNGVNSNELDIVAIAVGTTVPVFCCCSCGLVLLLWLLFLSKMHPDEVEEVKYSVIAKLKFLRTARKYDPTKAYQDNLRDLAYAPVVNMKVQQVQHERKGRPMSIRV